MVGGEWVLKAVSSSDLYDDHGMIGKKCKFFSSPNVNGYMLCFNVPLECVRTGVSCFETRIVIGG